MAFSDQWPENKDDQFTLQFRCTSEIRKYFPKQLFRGSIILEKKEAHGVIYKKILWIYFIESLKPGRGNIQRAIKKLMKDNYDVRIVLPGNAMTHIAQKFGFIQKYENIRNYPGDTEYWMKPERCAGGYTSPAASDCAWCTVNKDCKFKMFMEEYAYVI
jgi:hypothetical protein